MVITVSLDEVVDRMLERDILVSFSPNGVISSVENWEYEVFRVH